MYLQTLFSLSLSLSPTPPLSPVPADPVTNLRTFDVGERSVSLSWMTGADGFTPITAIEITITPERGDSPSPNPMIIDPSMSSTVVSNLLPFRRYEFSVAVRNAAGLSTNVSINANTLSLRKCYACEFM